MLPSFGLIRPAPPTARISGPNKTVTQGSPVSFTCTATGDATIQFAWRDKDNVPISNNSVYTVNNVTGQITINATNYARDHGALHCTAYNNDIVDASQVADSATAFINVEGEIVVISANYIILI